MAVGITGSIIFVMKDCVKWRYWLHQSLYQEAELSKSYSLHLNHLSHRKRTYQFPGPYNANSQVALKIHSKSFGRLQSADHPSRRSYENDSPLHQKGLKHLRCVMTVPGSLYHVSLVIILIPPHPATIFLYPDHQSLQELVRVSSGSLQTVQGYPLIQSYNLQVVKDWKSQTAV